MESGSGMDQWAGRQAWRGKGPVGCVEACLDEILALGLGDALGDREGARRMGGRGRGLGHREWTWGDREAIVSPVEAARGWADRGGDWEVLRDDYGSGGTGVATRRSWR